jgi:hypothetical protein
MRDHGASSLRNSGICFDRRASSHGRRRSSVGPTSSRIRTLQSLLSSRSLSRIASGKSRFPRNSPIALTSGRGSLALRKSSRILAASAGWPSSSSGSGWRSMRGMGTDTSGFSRQSGLPLSAASCTTWSPPMPSPIRSRIDFLIAAELLDAPGPIGGFGLAIALRTRSSRLRVPKSNRTKKRNAGTRTDKGHPSVCANVLRLGLFGLDQTGCSALSRGRAHVSRADRDARSGRSAEACSHCWPDPASGRIRQSRRRDPLLSKGAIYLSQVDGRSGQPTLGQGESRAGDRVARARKRDASPEANA